jgi:hypothetical protein
MLEGKRQKLNFLRRLRPEATQDRDSRKLKIVGGSSSRTQFRAPGMAGLKIRACEVSLRTESPKIAVSLFRGLHPQSPKFTFSSHASCPPYRIPEKRKGTATFQSALQSKRKRREIWG